MTPTMTSTPAPATSDLPTHTTATRVVHGALAVAVVIQLLSSLRMVVAEDGRPGNSIFGIHQYVGMAAFVFVLGFWVVTLTRQHGVGLGALFPWLSPSRLRALVDDLESHLRDLKDRRLPTYDRSSPLAAAAHGVGLLLITAMAGSGTLYYFVNSGSPDAGGLVGVAMTIHKTAANMAWGYLIAHASMSVLYHFASEMSLKHMWSPRT